MPPPILFTVSVGACITDENGIWKVTKLMNEGCIGFYGLASCQERQL